MFSMNVFMSAFAFSVWKESSYILAAVTACNIDFSFIFITSLMHLFN